MVLNQNENPKPPLLPFRRRLSDFKIGGGNGWCEYLLLMCACLTLILIYFSNSEIIYRSGYIDNFHDQKGGSDHFTNSKNGDTANMLIEDDFKVYIYDLPPMYNEDFLTYIRENETQRIYLSCLQDGVGLRVKLEGETKPQEFLRDGDQFCLEVIFHERLLRQKHLITTDPTEANVFYVPFYVAMDQSFNPWPIPVHPPTVAPRPREMEISRVFFTLLGRHPVYRALGEQNHVMTLGRVQREFYKNTLNFLREYRPFTDHFFFFGIEQMEERGEKESKIVNWGRQNEKWRETFKKYKAALKKIKDENLDEQKTLDKLVNDRKLEPVIYSKFFRDNQNKEGLPWVGERPDNVFPMPYPGMVHVVKGEKMPWMNMGTRIKSMGDKGSGIEWKRLILAVFNARMPEREKMRDLCDKEADQVCEFHNSKYGFANIYRAMTESVFCLNPRGDSWTRRGIYDAISCGCISVQFENIPLPWGKSIAKNPFSYSCGIGEKEQELVNNPDFVPKIEDVSVIVPKDKKMDYVNYLKSIPPSEITRLQNNIKKYGNFYVYSYPKTGVYQHHLTPGSNDNKGIVPDAFDLALAFLREKFKDKPLKSRKEEFAPLVKSGAAKGQESLPLPRT
eukprot:Nk52_evm10s242 gene=Nk52_evmTU10s242